MFKIENIEILSYNELLIFEHLTSAFSWKYIKNYFENANYQPKSVIIEDKYIDKDYMIDYCNFYARSFNPPFNFTKRFHFFTLDYNELGEIIHRIKDGLESDERIEIFKQSYLGFVVEKPIKDRKGNILLGRCCLKTYSTEINNGYRYYVRTLIPVHLLGINFDIESFPFQPQDSAVMACASAALWSAIRGLRNRFNLPDLSPYEITQIATSFPSEGRNFPSEEGLTLNQMLNVISYLGLDTETLDIQNIHNLEVSNHPTIIADFIRAYLHGNFPIIALLELVSGRKKSFHSVVITGYRYENNKITELYIHDDQIGPYSKVLSDNNFAEWENEWNRDFEKIKLRKLIVPVYHKLRLTFKTIYSIVRNIRQEKNLNFFFFISDINNYKKELLYNPNIKSNFFFKSCPKFVWVIRAFQYENIIWDSIYDATNHNINNIGKIIYLT